MRVGVITGPGEVELRTTPTPEVGPDDVLIEIGACGVCTLERRMFAGEKKLYPVAAGHETGGIVVAVGEKIDGFDGAPQVGDRVTMDQLTRCGTCHPCRRGRTALCRRRQGGMLPDGTITIGAGFSDYVVVNARQAYLTGDAPVEHAAMGEPMACVAHSLRMGGFRPGDRVAIIGGGFMGRLHLAQCRIGGSPQIGIVEPLAERRAAAETAGAAWTATPEDALEVGGPNDVVFVTAPAGVDLAVEMCDYGGTVVLFSAFPKDDVARLPSDLSHRKEISIVGAFSQEPDDWRMASSLIRSGVIAGDLDEMVSARFDLDHVADALRLVTTEPTFRVMVGSGVS